MLAASGLLCRTTRCYLDPEELDAAFTEVVCQSQPDLFGNTHWLYYNLVAVHACYRPCVCLPTHFVSHYYVVAPVVAFGVDDSTRAYLSIGGNDGTSAGHGVGSAIFESAGSAQLQRLPLLCVHVQQDASDADVILVQYPVDIPIPSSSDSDHSCGATSCALRYITLLYNGRTGHAATTLPAQCCLRPVQRLLNTGQISRRDARPPAASMLCAMACLSNSSAGDTCHLVLVWVCGA